ncbi:hypothetical protein CLF_109829 [Clonorchis sinensis]|uniref:Endonuclease/exonuclease/phosphatase domain-containing protein n=1 Tax=Clonorchis sinensis TaxID=79923 RepID=G7YJU8_CLOSI|nr:hypothetical protein CLF_109829 [Clonorchis sinensis]
MEVSTIDDPLLADTPDSVRLSACRANPPFILGCLYVPPPHSTSSINRLSTLLSHNHALPHPNKLIVGDLNLPEIAWSQQNSRLRLSPLLAQLNVEGWSQLVRQPTRGTHTLDIALVNGYLCPTAAVVPKFPDSDHCIVTCSWTSTQTNPTLPPLTSFTLSPDILEAFAISLRHKAWDDFFLSDDTQSVANIFYGNLLSSLHPVAPTRDSYVSGRHPATRLSAIGHKLRKYRKFFLNPMISTSLLYLTNL